MRALAVLLAIAVAAPAMAADAPASRKGGPAADCPRTTSHLAEQIGSYRGKRLEPKKLNELPGGTAYMAVYRQIGGCDAPLTMVDYRNLRRR